MKILVTGNLGYVGPCVIRQLRREIPVAHLVGYDAGYFADALLESPPSPDTLPHEQHLGDVRDLPDHCLQGVDAIVHLAGISNDPIGNEFSETTLQVNCGATAALAGKARAAGVKSFVFASSCSIYGFAEDGERTEDSAVNPLTAYARSKHEAEQRLAELAGPTFTITCLRFATACGMSPRLRLDLVLNDFVATAMRTGEVRVLSDGSPWRPLINTADMARAIEWAALRTAPNGGEFLALNTGSNSWNYQVRDLAAAVARALPGTVVRINEDARPDKRSYRVRFDRFGKLAPRYQPVATLESTISDLISGLQRAGARAQGFDPEVFVRLKTLVRLKQEHRLDASLRWSAAATATAGR